MKSKVTNKELKEWVPNPDQLEFIKNKWAVYNDPPRTYTKTRICEMFKISDVLFMRLVAKHKIKAKKEPKGYIKDFTAYKRVPVPCEYGCPTFILIHPDRDAEQARKAYIKKHKARTKKQSGNEYGD